MTLLHEKVAPELKQVTPDLNMVTPNLNMVMPDLNMVTPDLNMAMPDLSMVMPDLKNVISVARGRKRTPGTPNRASQGNGLEKLKPICLSLQAQDADGIGGF